MKRVKKLKGKGSKLTKKEKNHIVVYIVKKILPQYVALVLMAVKYEFNADQDSMKNIIKRVNKYTAAIDAGVLNLENIKNNLEIELNMKLDEVFGDKGIFDEALEGGVE